MQFETELPPLVVILGPTAVGKTRLSLALADEFEGEIVSADSRLFYRGMDIGTAKPSRAEQAAVPHHLVDVADPDETWSLGRFKQNAIQLIDEIHARGKLPFLVGGTGQFIRAIIDGWQVPELPADERLRNVLTDWAEEIGAEGLYHRLAYLDPEAAEKILSGNVRRTIRALEVIFHTGRLFSEVRRREKVPYSILQIGLDRPRTEIDRRIGERVDQMMADGFLDEVGTLLEDGISRDLPSMTAIGYQQLAAHLAGEISLEEAIEETKRATRKYYRRQMNWFKRTDERIVWFEAGEDPLVDVISRVRRFLTG
jgi:tRNA dimethylallyltransferase